MNGNWAHNPTSSLLLTRASWFIVAMCMHCIRAAGVGVMICLLSGCWEEIEYRGSDSATESQRAITVATANQPEEASTVVASELPPGIPIEESPQQVQEENAAETALYAGDVEQAPVDDLSQVVKPPAETTVTSVEQPALAPVTNSVDPASFQIPGGARRAAWQLGSKLTLAALANDRGIARDEVPKWFAEAQTMGAELNIEIAPLPARPSAPEEEAASRDVLSYILGQEKAIGTEILNEYGPADAALFQLATRTNLLLVLNEPGTKAVQTIIKSIEALGPRTDLPNDLWQPLVGLLKRGENPADVRAAVRQMHDDVSRHLAEL